MRGGSPTNAHFVIMLPFESITWRATSDLNIRRRIIKIVSVNCNKNYLKKNTFWGYLLIKFWRGRNSIKCFSSCISRSFKNSRITDAPWSLFSLKSRNLSLGRQILGHMGYFRLNYQHPFWYSDSLVHAFNYSTIISIHIPNILEGDLAFVCS